MSVIALICEGPDDGRVVPVLVNRLVADTVEWVHDQPGLVTWRGCEAHGIYTTWSRLEHLALPRSRPNAPPQFAAGLPGSDDGFDARKALLLLDGLGSGDRPEAVVLQRDDDRDETHRRRDLELARDNDPWAFAVVIGIASPMIEAWVLAGFVPDDREQAAHAEIRRHLGFDPCRQAHRLSPRHEDESKQPKAVRERLTGNHWPREQACLSEPWTLLETNGEHSGLAAFIAEVRARLIPQAFGTPSPR